jgi:hypothetical protein
MTGEAATCPYRHDVAPPPKFMQQLPVFRGYPVPFFVQWLPNGEPEFRAMDPRRFRAAIDKNLCWTCGNPMLGSERVFVIGPMCAVNRISSEPPSHRECATYAAMYCPFLSKPHMVRREDGLVDIKAAAGVMIARNPGATLLWYTRHYRVLDVNGRPGVAGKGKLFQIGRPFHVEWYCRGRIAKREEIVEAFESGLPILREHAAKYDGPEGVIHLENQITKAWRLVPKQ